MMSVLSKTFRAGKAYARKGAAVAALVALAGCNGVALPTGGDSGPKIDTSKAVKVALLVPGGSANPSDGLLARNLENAARLAIADLGDVKIDLKVYNTAGQAGTAASVAARAADEGAKIIVGPLYAEAANAAGVAVAGKNVNVLAFSNNTAIAGGNVFILGSTFDNTANRLLGFARRQGKSKVAIVHDRTTPGEVGRDAISGAASRNGMSVATVQAYEFSQNGIVAAAPGIANAVKSSGADSVFFTADTAGALPLLAQLLPENGVSSSTSQFIGLTRWDIPPATLALPGVQGGWYALPDPGLTAGFRSRYQAAYGEPPHPIAGLSYDGIAAVGALIKSGKSNALTTSALTQRSGFVGTQGVFRFLPGGTNERGLAIAQIQNNKVVVIDPAPRSFGGAGF